LELRPAVQAHELLSLDLEDDGHDRAGRARSRISIPRYLADLRILEDRGVELRGLLGPAVEPQARHDPLHERSFLSHGCHAGHPRSGTSAKGNTDPPGADSKRFVRPSAPGVLEMRDVGGGDGPQELEAVQVVAEVL